MPVLEYDIDIFFYLIIGDIIENIILTRYELIVW